MRAWLAVAALLAPGCILADPAPAERRMEVRDGPWVATFSWTDLTGAPGDEARFHVALRSEGPASERLFVSPSQRWVRLDGEGAGRSVALPPEGGEVAGSALVGAAHRVVVQVVAYNGTGADLRSFTLQGPTVRVADDVATVERIAPVRAQDFDAAPGLSASADGRRAVATFASRAPATLDCHETVAPDGDFLLVRLPDGRLRLVGFAARLSSDACAPVENATRPVLVAATGELPPGEVEVLVVASVECFCLQREWARSETLVRVG